MKINDMLTYDELKNITIESAKDTKRLSKIRKIWSILELYIEKDNIEHVYAKNPFEGILEIYAFKKNGTIIKIKEKEEKIKISVMYKENIEKVEIETSLEDEKSIFLNIYYKNNEIEFFNSLVDSNQYWESAFADKLITISHIYIN